MAHLVGNFRLGRDAEKVDTENGSFLSLSLAYDYYNQEEKTQWVRVTLGGNRTESLLPHLKKGTEIYAVVENLHVRQFDREDGTKSAALEGRILGGVKFVGAKRERSETATTD